MSGSKGTAAIVLALLALGGLMAFDRYRVESRGERLAANLIADAAGQENDKAVTPSASRTSGESTPQASQEPATSSAPAAAAAKMRIGMNPSAITDYQPAWVFVDAMKNSRPWTVQPGNGPPVNTTADGWPVLNPGQIAETLLFQINGHYPAGTYVCTYAGQGSLEFKFDARVVSRAGNRLLVAVSPSGAGIALQIKSSAPADPVRDVRLWMPGYENATSPFHPLFLQRLKPFKCVRFMDWGETNHSQLRHWADRTTLTSCSQATQKFDPRIKWAWGQGHAWGKGVAVEYMVDLCNELHCDGWFCIPHLADDDYIRQFARLIKTRLNPESKVYIEYSNECWNPTFLQAAWCEDQGVAAGLDSDRFTAKAKFYGSKANQAVNVFRDAFGDAGRVVRVFASQHVNLWHGKISLEQQDAYKGFDVVAVAPYFGGSVSANDDPKGVSAAKVLANGLDGIFSACETDIAANAKFTAEWAALAKSHGLGLVAYESGESFTPSGNAMNNRPLGQLYIQANRDPRMGELYRKDMAAQQAAGMSLYNAFAFIAPNGDGRFGCWGALEWQDQEPGSAPKYQALATAAAAANEP